MKSILRSAVFVAAVGFAASGASAATLDDVKSNGSVKCGVNTGLAGFAAPNDKGEALNGTGKPLNGRGKLAA